MHWLTLSSQRNHSETDNSTCYVLNKEAGPIINRVPDEDNIQIETSMDQQRDTISSLLERIKVLETQNEALRKKQIAIIGEFEILSNDVI